MGVERRRRGDYSENDYFRIAGFSAYFVELWKNMQDDVINRTEVGI